MNIKRAKKEIKNTVQAYLQKDMHGEYVIPEVRQRPILLMGPPGIGKTQIMQQIAGECQIGLVAYTITHHTRQSAVGLPFIKEEVYGDNSYPVTEYTMSEIISSIYRYIRDTGREEGILFIDEINCVSETLAPTMLQFLQCKTFGNQAVPRGWIIAAAGNPPEYNKSVRDFDFVTLDRVRRMDVEADLAVFKEYARDHQIHPFILSYLELRPQNFYRTENDVDGMQFVTARGWEDLSYLIKSYEDLSIRVDEDVIRQFLQHEDVAKDVAAYYDLYQKYREEYDISNILQGKVKPDIYQRLFTASFDERLSCVELLCDGLIRRMSDAMEEDRISTDCYEFLRLYKSVLGEQKDREEKMQSSGEDAAESLTESPLTIYQHLLHNKEESLKISETTGLLDQGEKNHQLTVLSMLRTWAPVGVWDAKDAFMSVRTRFEHQTARREDSIRQAADALEYAFTFMEEAFGEGQEMVVFVTELTMNPKAAAFLAENGCERYYKYNRSLLIGTRRAEILNELQRDEIYSSALEYDF
ncbi:MAG: ATP-binding protein [Eubacterium sp.]|nr:ATP-binding protein [Eubacterium sp.]